MRNSIALPGAQRGAVSTTGGPAAVSSERPGPGLLILLGLIGLLFGALVLFLYNEPAVFGILALIPLFGVIWHRPNFGLYFVLAAALLLEQYDITGLSNPITGRIPLFVNINSWTFASIPWLTANLLEVILVWTAAAWWFRVKRKTGEKVNLGGLGAPLIVFMVTIAFAWVLGILQGGDFKTSLWEVRALFYMAGCYLLTVNMIKTRGQVRILTWIIIVMIGIKALQGIYRYFVPFGGDLTGIYAITGHEDALFFDTLFVLALAFAIYGGPIRQRLLTWGLAPFTAFTFIATRRRAAIFALLVGIVTIIFTLPAQKRSMLPKILVPFFLFGLIYAGAFWNSTSTLGQPVQLVKSLWAPTNDRDASSNLYRDWEQYNVMTTIRHNPILGVGFGRPYEMILQLPEIEFPLRDYIPHNEILWVWLKTGTIGFIIFWLFIAAAIIQGSIVLRKIRDPYFQSLAAVVLALVMMQVVVAYGDLQLTFYRNMVYLGVMLGLLMRLEALDPLLQRVRALTEERGKRPQRLTSHLVVDTAHLDAADAK